MSRYLQGKGQQSGISHELPGYRGAWMRQSGKSGRRTLAEYPGNRTVFREIRKRIPELLMELRASGGHRMEPSMLMPGDMVSFSDAHEEKEIPVIAANIQRLVPPGKRQIWAVLRREDPARRIVYSIIST